jgi:membrane associated rhomboid family serine protease
MIPTGDTIGWTARPTVTYSLIAICVAAFVYQLSLSSSELQTFLMQHALVPRRYFSPSWARENGLSSLDLSPFVTNMFLHGGFLHILLNLWVLWVFGPALEDRLGSQRFLTLYLASGIAASMLHALVNLTSTVPALGASGAIAGVIAAYARRFPYAWVNVLQPIFFIPFFFPMPALLFAGLWFFMQVMQGAGSLMMTGAGGVAWFAHIGGFVAGWILIRRLAPAADPQRERSDTVRSAMWPWTLWSRWWWPKR